MSSPIGNLAWYEMNVGGTVLKNPQIIAHMAGDPWFGSAKPGHGHKLVMSLPDDSLMGGTIDVKFHRVYLYDSQGDENSPRMTVSLRAEGRSGRTDVYAMLNVDVHHPNSGIIATFSPVPFGLNGKPILPEELSLELASAALRVNAWSDASGTTFVKDHVRDWAEKNLGRDFPDDDVEKAIGILEEMGIVMQVQWHLYQPLMTAERFEQVFGVKLPEISSASAQ